MEGIVDGMNKKFVITVGILLIITGITGIYMVINNVSGSWGRIVTGLFKAMYEELPAPKPRKRK